MRTLRTLNTNKVLPLRPNAWHNAPRGLRSPMLAKRSPRPYEPLKVGQIAALLGWPQWRARRWLDGIAKNDPSVVTRVNGARRVTLAAMQRVMPEFAKRLSSANEVEELRYEMTQQKAELYELAKEFAAFRKQSREWYRSLAARMNAAEKEIRRTKS